MAEVQTSLAAQLSKKTKFSGFKTWIVGDTPIITHAWSEKAKREMLQKQVKATKAGKESSRPAVGFVSSLYEMGDGVYGFPATGVKNCILSAAHKDKGIARTGVMSALWINAEMVRVRPALAGAVCDMPLIRIHGSAPEMREDMVKIGAGLNKTAKSRLSGAVHHLGDADHGPVQPGGRLGRGAGVPDRGIRFLCRSRRVAQRAQGHVRRVPHGGCRGRTCLGQLRGRQRPVAGSRVLSGGG
jgi:hypothetical protein